jgi:L-aspartate oxidase
VAGEVACTSLHGANRLASNSLLKEIVFARRVVQPSIDHMKSSKHDLSTSNWWGRPVVPSSLGSDAIDKILTMTRATRKELQSVIWDYMGIVRSTTRLEFAEQNIGEFEAKWEKYLF